MTAGAEQELERLRFPIGRFRARSGLDAGGRAELIDDLEALPAALRAAVDDLPEGGLDTPYRPGGWTVRQVVHHLPDSHLNAYVRFKLAATETEPTIKPYDEAAWAELDDARGEDVEGSLLLLEALHRRWCRFLRSLAEDDFARAFQHPEMGRVALDTSLQIYAWHGRHHLGHVRSVLDRERG